MGARFSTMSGVKKRFGTSRRFSTRMADGLYLLRQLLGDDRILYGTDAPYDMADYGQLDGIEDKEAARRIGCQNAIRWLRL